MIYLMTLDLKVNPVIVRFWNKMRNTEIKISQATQPKRNKTFIVSAVFDYWAI